MILLYVLAGLFIVAGLLHFISPTPFLKIMPRWVPFPTIANWLSGAIEVLAGVGLLFSATRSVSAWVLIALLIAVFPANWRHYQLTKGTKFEPITLLRLPLQLLLIYWVFKYT